MTAQPYIVEHKQPCEDCHGTGERHPTTRGYMSHEIRDCESCGRSGETVLYREVFATLDGEGGARDAVHDRFNVYLDTLGDEAYRSMDVRVDDLRAEINALAGSGGSIELPDGSVIEVEATGWSGWSALWDALAPESRPLLGAGNDLLAWRTLTLAAWTAEHGIGIEAAR